MRLHWSFFFLIVFATLTGCGGPAANEVIGTKPGPAASPSPTVATDTSQKVTITSPDGVQIVGSFYEAAKPDSPALLLLHQWQSDRHSFDDFAKQMQRVGFNVLSIDGRGFGESTKKADGSKVSAGRMNTDVSAMIDDVGAAYDFLVKNNMVDPKRIGIVGASYGSSLAFIYAANKPDVAAVALLSPGLNYFGNLEVEPAMKKYGKRPVFMAASDDDKESADAVRKLIPDGAPAQHVKRTYPTGGHGTAMFKSQPGLVGDLQVFFSEHLQGAAK